MKYNLKETEKAYIAGFFDGEGHISITKKKPNPPRWKNPSYQLRATITNTNESIIDGINLSFENIGHKYGPYKSSFSNGKPLFQLHFVGSACQLFLKAISPYLVLKRNQAELALQYALFIGVTCPNHGLTSFELNAREEMFQTMKTLNHKGVVECAL
jgi:hypothetical protein